MPWLVMPTKMANVVRVVDAKSSKTEFRASLKFSGNAVGKPRSENKDDKHDLVIARPSRKSGSSIAMSKR